MQSSTALRAAGTLADGLDATNLVWTTDGTGGVGWSYHAGSGGGNDTFDGIASAQSGHISDNGETWIQTTVVGPGTVSFWWQAYSEPNADWLEFYVNTTLQARVSGGGNDLSTWASGWQYCSFQVPAGTNALRWRYVKDGSLTGGTLDTVWVDQVSYVTSPPPPLEQALNTSGILWNSSGSVYPNGWFTQTNVTHDGQWAAQSGAVWHNQTNWLQATVSGTTNVSFWWKVSSDTADYLQFYINGALAGQISGEVDWQAAYFDLPAATNVLTWQYGRNDLITAGSNCGWLDQVSFNTNAPANRTNTSTTVNGSGKASVFGQAVSFTATVTASGSGSGTPTGLVTFKEGTTTLGAASLSAGSATFSTSALSVGSHSITAVYGGDGSFNGSTSAAASQTVNQASSTTTLASSASPSVFGQAVTFTATVSAVSPGSGTPGGTVTFKDGTTTLGTATLSSGQATLTNSSLSVGSHSVTAVYGGDVSFKTSTSSGLSQAVSKDATSVALDSTVNPSVFGQMVIFTVNVSAAAPGGGTPTGTVTVKDGGTTLATATLGSGQAIYGTAALAVGGHSITVVYNGDANFNTSTSAIMSQAVSKADSSVALGSSTNTSVFGQAIIFTANVSAVSPGAGAPTGTVIFMDGATSLRTNALVSGQASYTNAVLSVASHSITALYNGDSSFNADTSGVVTQTVNRADTTTTVASSANPAVFGQPVTFTATVNAVAPGAGTRSGTVQFAIDGSAIGSPVSLSGGTATSSAVSSLAVAGHTVTATYSGDTNFNGSDNSAAPLAQTVNAASSTTTVASSANPSVSGQSLTFTATVSAAAPGSGTPTGTVTFKDGGITLGTGTLSAGQATFATSALSVASHSITAVYGGDTSFNSSTSSTLSQTVNKSGSSVVINSSANPSVFGQSVTFTAIVSASGSGSGTPTGTVTLKDGATALATNSLGGGQATFTTSSLSIASHSITAVYNGDTSFNTSTSAALSQTVGKADSAVALNSSTNPIVFGQAVVFTASVGASGAGSGTPTGTVIFKDGATALWTNALVAGQASYTNNSLNAAEHLITAVYNGDTSFSTNTSSVVTQTVNQASTTTTVASSVNPSVFGQPITFTATVNAVAPGAGTPSGTVQFSIDGSAFGSPVALSGGTAASGAISSLAAAGHTVTAAYSGDNNFSGSDNTGAPVTQVVNQASTTTTVASSANPSVFGQSVTFTATVSAVAPGAGTRTGTVQFAIDGVAFGAPVALSGGTATSSATSLLSAAGHSVTAVYSGDTNSTGSDNTASPLTQTVNPASTTTTVASSQNPSVFGQLVTFTATVSTGAGTPTGTVTFKDGAATIGTGTLDGTLHAALATATLPAASHSITAVYSGNGNYSGSTSAALTQTVNKAGTSTAIASSQNPSVFGQPVTFTATVSPTAPGADTPTGTVTFKDGATSLATNSLSGGQALLSLSTLSAASHSITAVYNGDPSFNPSTSSSLTQTVDKAASTTTLASSQNPSVSGQVVTFTATVAAVAPGAGTPTGTVQFKTNGVSFGSAVTLSGGSATSSATSLLPAGNTAVTAVYNGDTGFNTSSDTLAGGQSVTMANSLTTVSSSANPSVSGQAVTFTATVTAVSPGTGTPTGTVQFKTNGVNFGSAVTLSGGAASSPALSSLAVGTVTVTALYSGNSSFNSSDNTASPFTQTIDKAATTTTITPSKNPSSVGDPVSWTATVSAAAPGSGTPSGTVQFKVDGTNFDGLLTLSAGSATTLATATLPTGSHTITAVYSGDDNFNTNTSADFTQTVSTSPVTPATGGDAISADTTGGTYSPLTGPVYAEATLGAVGVGTIILNAPAGFVFDTGGTAPTVKITGNASNTKNINDAVSGTALAMTSVTATQLTFTVTAASSGGGTPNTLTWQNIRVRPTAGTPLALGSITKTGTSTMNGVATGANFGFLAEAAGAASRLVVQTPPSTTATAGITFAQQPKIQIQDQFGNARTIANRNADNGTVVTAARSAGSATLQGNLTATAANGLAAFSNLSYTKAETITLQFISGSLTGVTSGNVLIGPAAADHLVFTTQPGSVTYGSDFNPQPMVQSRDAFGNDSTVGLAASQMVTLGLSAGTGALQGETARDIGTSAGNGFVAFPGLKVGAAGSGKQLTAAAAGLASAASSTFDISPATVTPTVTVASKLYDGTMAATVTGRSLNGVVGGDDVTLGASGTAVFGDKNVGAGKPVSITGLSLSGLTAANYALSATTASTAADITARPITVTAVEDEKLYDGTTNSAGVPMITAGSLVAGDTAVFTQAFDSKDVLTAHLLIPLGSVNDGNGGSNYAITFSNFVTHSILPKPMTVTAADAARVYGAPNPAFTASYSGFVPGEDASVLGGSPSVSTSADSNSPVDGSPYSITVSQGTLTNANYTFLFTDGHLQVTPATVTVGVASDKETFPQTDGVTLAVVTVADDPSAATPSGSVQFVANGTNSLGGPVTLVNGAATLTVSGSALALGSNTITASFSDPSGNFNSSSGDLNPALVVTAGTVSLPPVIQSLTPQPDGSMEVRASGAALQTYLVQASSTLGAWATIGTNVSDASGSIVFLDPDAPNHTSRFYRLAAP